LTAAGAAGLGWNHPVIREALEGVLNTGAPLLSLDFNTPLYEGFRDELLRSFPAAFGEDAVVHLCAPSGANAIEAALALTEIVTGQEEHVALEGGFHGCTAGARLISSGGHPRARDRRSSARRHFLPYPQDYRCPFGVGGDQGVELAIRTAEQLLTGAASPLERPASLTVECIQGEAGVIPGDARWLRALRDLTLRVKVPLIVDEIQTGVCRTGTMWSFESAGIIPDLVVVSKALGGGLPIAALVFRTGLNVWKEGAFTGTFRGNAFGFAAATAVLRFARTEDLASRVQSTGDRLTRALRLIQERSSVIAEVRGRGLMIGVEIVDPHGTPDARGVRRPSPTVARRIQSHCFDEGLIVEVGGVHGNVVRFLPPLTITDAEVDIVAELFEKAVRRTPVVSTDLTPGDLLTWTL
jgi:diaminobutyrate-2-oxoglutarate transaminase